MGCLTFFSSSLVHFVSTRFRAPSREWRIRNNLALFIALYSVAYHDVQHFVAVLLKLIDRMAVHDTC